MINKYFFTIEGIEGSGKTSQMNAIKDFLEGRDLKVFLTRQPGGTELGARIRAILLDPKSKALVPKAEALLYLADRAQHIEEEILPRTKSGIYVICDRYHDSTIAYQNAGRGLNNTSFSVVIDSIYRSLECVPVRTYVLDLDPEEGLDRAWKSIRETGDTQTRFEQEKLDFHNKVREQYLQIASAEPGRVCVIDAGRPKEKVTEDILKDIESHVI